MYCRNCGTKLPDDSRFCRACGTPTSVGEVTGFQEIQPNPQERHEQPFFFVPPELRQDFPARGDWQPEYGQPGVSRPGTPPVTGALLGQAERVSRYNGDGPIGPVTGSGNLYVYDDRVEFEKKSGDQRGYMLGPLVGAVVARNSAKKNPVDVYEFRDLIQVRTGKYAGMMGTLVLELGDRKKVSFVIGRGGKELAEELCGLINQYL
jgi:hypothetical protein